MTQNMLKNPSAHRDATDPEFVTPKAALETVRQPTPVFGEDGFPDESVESGEWFDPGDEADTGEAEDAADNLTPPVLPLPETLWQALINDAITRIAACRGHEVARILNFPFRPVEEPPAIALATVLSKEEIEVLISTQN